MDMHEAVAAEMKQLERQRDALCDKKHIKPYLQLVEDYVKKTQGREITINERRNIAQCLDNATVDAGNRAGRRLFEATTTEDHISFLGIQLPVIAALLPSLVMNDIAVVQALDRRIGAVFYLNVTAGSTKGDVTTGDTLHSAKTGYNTKLGARQFAMAGSPRETIGTGNGTHAGTTDINPGLILLDQAYVERLTAGGTYETLGTFSAAGVLTSSGVAGVTISGTIAAAGTYSVVVAGLDSSDTVLLTYFYQYDLPQDAYGNKTGVPEEDITVTQETVTAMDFPIRAKYSVGASIDLQKAHGLNLEDELVKYLGGSVKFAIDQKGLDMMIAAGTGTGCATAPTSWNAAIHSGQAWLWHKYEFLDRLNEASNNIFDKTKRGVANFIIAGNNVARVIRQLTQGGDFKPSAGLDKQIPTGPINIGNIASVNNMTVIQNPTMTTNDYVCGFKGDSYLYAGFIYAPYIPLFATPTLITSDLIAQKGFLSAAGFKVINPGLFCKGSITGLGTTA
jgi:hypothetical protein